MSWEVRGDGAKPLLHLWSEQFNLTRRVLAITDHSEQRLVLAVERFGAANPSGSNLFAGNLNAAHAKFRARDSATALSTFLRSSFPMKRWIELPWRCHQRAHHSSEECLRHCCAPSRGTRFKTRRGTLRARLGNEYSRKNRPRRAGHLATWLVPNRESDALLAQSRQALDAIVAAAPNAVTLYPAAQSREVWLRYRGLPFRALGRWPRFFRGHRRQRGAHSRFAPGVAASSAGFGGSPSSAGQRYASFIPPRPAGAPAGIHRSRGRYARRRHAR